jgi:hypothetical protein
VENVVEKIGGLRFSRAGNGDWGQAEIRVRRIGAPQGVPFYYAGFSQIETFPPRIF